MITAPPAASWLRGRRRGNRGVHYRQDENVNPQAILVHGGPLASRNFNHTLFHCGHGLRPPGTSPTRSTAYRAFARPLRRVNGLPEAGHARTERPAHVPARRIVGDVGRAGGDHTGHTLIVVVVDEAVAGIESAPALARLADAVARPDDEIQQLRSRYTARGA